MLSLGLVFIRGIFAALDKISGEVFRQAQEEINRNMAPDQKFYVGGTTITVKSGKQTPVNAGVQNFGDIEEQTNQFSLSIKPGDQGGSENWFVLPPKISVPVGEKKATPFIIKLPKGIEPGKTYTFTVTALKDGQLYDSQIIIIVVE